MKRTMKALLEAVVFLTLCLCLAACSKGITGTYKFSSMSMNQGGLSVDVKAGEAFMGVTVTEDAYTLTVNEDNTWTMTVNMGQNVTQSGTWEEKDGKYVFTTDGETMEVTLSGNTLTFEQDGVKVVLKK